MKNNLILSVLALLSAILLFSVKSNDKQYEQKIFLKKPQEYMTQLFVTLFNEQGAIKDKLSAHYWSYLPEKEISTLTQPHLTIFRPDGTQWFIHSKSGQVLQPNIGTIEKIILQKDVLLERKASAITTAVTIETEELSYQPKKNLATSSYFVRLMKPGMTITGIGLKAFLDKGSVELLNDVKTYYTVDR